ncbi:hypothetical protein ADU20_27440 [Burkholderia pseudomallei]|uniref:hypothetical protein n=1 Tax=Burkholderia pseudomallei TaxID=28450 RepID=UPI000682B23E|nr:hypothetical protein [Burkholderia pseudomallei]KNA31056.1 hypothetical protein ADU20_27440 [Burkholderia pseudomallei]
MPSYTPPSQNAVYFRFSGSYSAPAHNAINLNLVPPTPNGYLQATLGNFTASIAASETISGTLAATLANFTAQFVEGEYYPMALTATLDNFTANIAAQESYPMTLAATLDDIAASIHVSTGVKRRAVIINT